MDNFSQLSKHPMNAPLGEFAALGNGTVQEWQKARQQATLTLKQHTDELRELMALMQTFSYQTSVETVIGAQSRMAALRWLIQSVEQEVQRLDKAYREAAQLEQLLKDQAMFSTP